MALSVQSTSQPFSATQVYIVTGTVGDTVTATVADTTVTQITPLSATISAAGTTFTATRNAPGGTTITFADAKTGESIPVEINHAGDPVADPSAVSGAIGTTVDVLITEENDPNAFASITVDNTTVAAYNVTSNGEGRAVVVLTLNSRGAATMSIDDGHGGTIAVPISVGTSSASTWVKIAGMQAVVGGNYVATGDTSLPLEDATSGYNGSGAYTVSLTSAGKFVVTNGIPPAESTTQINVASAVLRPDGTLYLSDGRTLQVTTNAVNSTVNFYPNQQGSYLADGVVTMDTLGADVKNLLSTAQSGDTEPAKPYQGELFFNTTTNVFEVFESGKWVTIAAVGAASALSGLTDVKISSPSGGQVLTWNATDGKWENTAIPSDTDSLAALTDVSVSSQTDGQVLTWSASASKWENKASTGGGSSTLASDTDVSISSPSDGQVLTYDGTASKWENKIATASSITQVMSLPTAGSAYRANVRVLDGTSPAPPPSYASDVESDAPIVYLRLNDTSGSTAAAAYGTPAGTYNGGVTLNQGSAVTDTTGSSVKLDGSTAYVSDSPTIPTSAISIGLWVKFNSLSTGNPRIFANSHTDTDGNGFQMYYSAGTLAFNLGTNHGQLTASWNSSGLTTGVWYFIVCTYDGTTALLYCNGVQRASASGTAGSTINTASYPVNIGRNPAYGGDYTSANVAEFFINGAALSSTRVAHLYTTGTTGPSNGTPDEPYILRERADGSYVWTRLGGRAIILKMCSADFTPTTPGVDKGGLVQVPYDPDENSDISITWTIVKMLFRVETAGTSVTNVNIQRSTGTGLFMNAGNLLSADLSLGSGVYEVSTRSFARATVNSGDKLMPYYTTIGSGVTGFTLHLVLRES